jgi:hypothetical protein
MEKYLSFNIGTTFFGGSNYLTQQTGVSTLIYVIASNVIIALGVIMVFTIVTSGISMIGASGNPQEFERARNLMTAAIIGFIIAVAAWFIVKFIEKQLGVSILS